jgi:hypothetical protein
VKFQLTGLDLLRVVQAIDELAEVADLPCPAQPRLVSQVTIAVGGLTAEFDVSRVDDTAWATIERWLP